MSHIWTKNIIQEWVFSKGMQSIKKVNHDPSYIPQCLTRILKENVAYSLSWLPSLNLRLLIFQVEIEHPSVPGPREHPLCPIVSWWRPAGPQWRRRGRGNSKKEQVSRGWVPTLCCIQGPPLYNKYMQVTYIYSQVSASQRYRDFKKDLRTASPMHS